MGNLRLVRTRLFYNTLLLSLITLSIRIETVSGFGSNEQLSTVDADADLFLEDEGSGGGYNGEFDVERGAGICAVDDEDCEVNNKNKIINSDTNSTPKSTKPPKPGVDDIVTEVHPEISHGVFNTKDESSYLQGSFFSQPGILAAIICGAIVGLLCAILLVMFIVYRMRKKDEGSYVLEDSKRSSSYGKTKEFYA